MGTTSNRKAFVTGATGLVGSHLVMKLLEKGYGVKALYRREASKSVFEDMAHWYQKPPDFFESIDWIKGELHETPVLAEAMQGTDVVYHCAAIVSFHPQDKPELESINIKGTRSVVNACVESGVKKLCHVSSTAALGQPAKGGKITEGIPWKRVKGVSNYSISKHYAELEVWRGMEEGLSVVMVNPSIVLGPGRWGKSSTNLVPTAASGLKFYPPGSNGFVDARDVAEIMTALVEKNIAGERFLCVGENLKFKQLFTALATELGTKPPKMATKRWMGELAWRFGRIVSLVTGKKFPLTRETISSAFSKKVYSNKKVKETLGHRFIPAEESIEHVAMCYKQTA